MALPQWRLIPYLEAPGAVQMGLDAWLFEQHCAALQPPTLRFYGWNPITLSLGYHQSRYPASWHGLTWQGNPIDVVRRPTGGRAVLHQGDLTYAVITSGLPAHRLAAYQQICEFLIEGWRSLGVSLHYGQAGRGYIHNPNCFGTATGADLLLADGTKFIGSAQLRRGTAALQHGSMPLMMDSTLYQQVFGVEPISLSSLSRVPFKTDWQAIAEALAASAQRCFDMELVSQPLSEPEWQTVLAISEAYKVSPSEPIDIDISEDG